METTLEVRVQVCGTNNCGLGLESIVMLARLYSSLEIGTGGRVKLAGIEDSN